MSVNQYRVSYNPSWLSASIKGALVAGDPGASLATKTRKS